MASEEKEPYFDGPLTPNTGLQNFNNPADAGIPNPGIQAQGIVPQEVSAVPMFYNPNNYEMQNNSMNVQAPMWNNHNNSNDGILQIAANQVDGSLHPQEAESGQVETEGIVLDPGNSGDNALLPTSTHTSPGHVLKPQAEMDGQLLTNEVGSEMQAEAMSHENVNQENSESPLKFLQVSQDNSFPGYNASNTQSGFINLEPENLQNHNYNQENVQNYLSPEHLSHSNSQASDLHQENLQEPSGHINLHNEGLATNFQSLDNDESYMNMAHSASGGALSSQNEGPFMFNASALREPQVIAGDHPHSGHDFDILHSQGTIQSNNHIFEATNQQIQNSLIGGYANQGGISDNDNIEILQHMDQLNLNDENNESLSMHGSSSQDNYQNVGSVAIIGSNSEIAQGNFGMRSSQGENLGIPQEIQTIPVIINSREDNVTIHQPQQEESNYNELDTNNQDTYNVPVLESNNENPVPEEDIGNVEIPVSPEKQAPENSSETPNKETADIESTSNDDQPVTIDTASGTRIRSQSIGSSHSNASSKRSTTQILSKSSTVPLVASTAKEEISADSNNAMPRSETIANPFSTDMMHSSHAQPIESLEPIANNPLHTSVVNPQPSLTHSNQPPIATVSANQTLHSQMSPTKTVKSNASRSFLVQSTSQSTNEIRDSVSSTQVTQPKTTTNTTPALVPQKMSDPYLSRANFQTNNFDQSNQSPSIGTSHLQPNNQSQQPGIHLQPSNQSQQPGPTYVQQTSQLQLPGSTHINPTSQSQQPVSNIQNNIQSSPSSTHQSGLQHQVGPTHITYSSQSQQSYNQSASQNYGQIPPPDNQQLINQDHRSEMRPSRPHSRDPSYHGDDHSSYNRQSDYYGGGYGRNQRFDPHNRYDGRRYDDRERVRPLSRQSEYLDEQPSYYRDDHDRDRRYSRDHRDYDDYYRRRQHDQYNRQYGYQSSYSRSDYYNSYNQHYTSDPYYQYGRSRDYYDGYRGYDNDKRSTYNDDYYRQPHPDSARSGYADSSYYNHSTYGYDQSGYYDDRAMDDTVLSNDLSWQNLPQVPQRQTPVKFMSTHVCARFGAGGYLIKVMPHRPEDNQATTVEIHSVEILLEKNKEAENLRSYPGPLSKEETHKNDVLQFATQRATESLNDVSLLDRQSTALLWNFLMLLVRQNGSVLGTDIAELLMKDTSGEFHFMQSPQDNIHRADVAPSPTGDTQSKSSVNEGHAGNSADVTTNPIIQHTHRFRELLLCGRRKDALEWAMKSGLWGHALLLASKTDSRTHAQVMLRFANSLPINDPLQTVYQLMSGRQPAAATCVSEEGWGDWRPHLAMMLSNPTSHASLDMRAVFTMGDTLAGRGLLHAAHFCYLMASTPLGYFGRPSTKLVLLGANHMSDFIAFATKDAIRRTEIYEYAISLGKSHQRASNNSALPSFQLYKFMYACNLATFGMNTQALHYCERIAKAIIARPRSYSIILTRQIIDLADQLKFHDTVSQMDVSSLKWIDTLKEVLTGIEGGEISANTPSILNTSQATSPIHSEPTTDELQFTAQSPHDDDESDVTSNSSDELDGHYDNQQTNNQQQDVDNQQYFNNAPQQANNQAYMTPAHSQYNNVQQHEPTMYNHQQPGQQYQQHGQHYQPPGQHHQQINQQNTVIAPTPPLYNVNQNDFNVMANQSNPLWNMQQSISMNTENQISQPETPITQEATPTQQNDFYENFAKPTGIPPKVASRSRTISQSSRHSHTSAVHQYQPYPSIQESHQRSRNPSSHSGGRRSRTTSEREQTENKKNKKKEEKKQEEGVSKSNSWSIFNLFRNRKSQVHLPDDNKDEKQIVWDNDKQKWVDLTATEEDNAPVAPPPMDAALGEMQSTSLHDQSNVNNVPMQPAQINTTAAPAAFNPTFNNPQAPSTGQQQAPPTMKANRFSLKNLGGNRSMYKQAFASAPAPSASVPAPLDMMPPATTRAVTGFMIPNPEPHKPSVEDYQPSEQPATNNQPQMFNPGSTNQPTGPTVMTQKYNNTSAQEPFGGVNQQQPNMFFNPSQFGGGQAVLTQPPMM